MIALIGILITVASVAYGNAQRKARDHQRKNDLETIRQALELFYQENGYYPAPDCSAGMFGGGFGEWSTGNDWLNYNSAVTGLNKLIGAGYLKKLPIDPINVDSSPFSSADNTFLYWYGCGAIFDNSDLNNLKATTYSLRANLENNNDPQRNYNDTFFYSDYEVHNP